MLRIGDRVICTNRKLAVLGVSGTVEKIWTILDVFTGYLVRPDLEFELMGLCKGDEEGLWGFFEGSLEVVQSPSVSNKYMELFE